jgi:DNA adenine methylase
VRDQQAEVFSFLARFGGLFLLPKILPEIIQQYFCNIPATFLQYFCNIATILHYKNPLKIWLLCIFSILMAHIFTDIISLPKTQRDLRTPITWFGGKGNMTAKLLKLIPPHHTYVEVFGGGASLLFAKKPSPVEVYNDLDSGLVNFFRVLRDPDKFEQFYKKVYFTSYSREEYYYCRDTWDTVEDEIERAYRWYVAARMSFSGEFGGSWGYVVTASNRNMAAKCSKWLSIIEMLPEIHARVMQVQIENRDFRQIFQSYDTPETLFYCDPPYIIETRRNGGYRYEMSLDDHRDLVEILLQIKGMAILSGYQHPVYTQLEESGWQRLDYKVPCYAVGRTKATGILGKGSAIKNQARTESIWISPKCKNRFTLF